MKFDEWIALYCGNDNDILHYGVSVDDGAPGRGSGRYPKGSGVDPQSYRNFLGKIKELEDSGYKPKDIARYFDLRGPKGDYSIDILRRKRSIAVNEVGKYEYMQMKSLREKGLGYSEIGRIMGYGESTVRSKLNSKKYEDGKDKNAQYADLFENRLEELNANGTRYLQIGEGTEAQLDISEDRLHVIEEILKDRGYSVVTIQVDQLGTGEGQKTSVKVLAPPGTKYSEVKNNYDKIGMLTDIPEEKKQQLEPPTSIDSSRIFVKLTDSSGHGGAERDGLIEVRPGVKDISLGKARYAQVRIAVDGTHYMKGMCVYSDDIPDGYDVVYNSNKSFGADKDEIFKKMKKGPDGKIDLENPFGASVKSEKELHHVNRYYIDDDGKKKKNAINVVNEETDWSEWDAKLSSQYLSKQTPDVAKKQLGITYDVTNEQFNDIRSLTNPTIRKYELMEFASQCDSAAEQLKAVGFAGQRAHVILPFKSIKNGEIYAPNYNNGDKVVAVRFPFSGNFESPILTVNNNNKEAKKVIGNGIDAVGINKMAADQLSGADFDGDTVQIIPLKNAKVNYSPAIPELRSFEPRLVYKVPKSRQIEEPENWGNMSKDERKKYIAEQVAEGKIKRMDHRTTQIQMGIVSNLITDMQLHDAPQEDIVKAVKHSMVVIDAEKHYLDWKQSERDNDIPKLHEIYQGKKTGGASTLISKAGSEDRNVRQRKEITRATEYMVQAGKITREEYNRWLRGEKIFKETGETHKNYDESTGKWVDTGKYKMTKASKMSLTNDARTLSSGTAMESVYADYANKMKAMANEARRMARNMPTVTRDISAAREYAKEVKSLRDKVTEAKKNKPFEKQAQIIAGAKMDRLREENPGLSNDEIKKWKNRYLTQARETLGATKPKLNITDREWEAIQKRAIGESLLNDILANTDRTKLKERAMPKERKSKLNEAKIAVAKARLAAGYTQSEVASELGVSVTTLIKEINN